MPELYSKQSIPETHFGSNPQYRRLIVEKEPANNRVYSQVLQQKHSMPHEIQYSSVGIKTK